MRWENTRTKGVNNEPKVGKSDNFDRMIILGGAKAREISRQARQAIAAIDEFADRCGQLSQTDEQAIHRARQTVRRIDNARQKTAYPF
jgi:hypothetical protein